MTGPRILVIRLGAMGDVIAALPAVASLKHSIPHSKITWAVEPKWSVLLEGNPYVDSVMHRPISWRNAPAALPARSSPI